MKKIKKIAASTLAAAALMTSALSFGASAYSDSGSWQFYSNPHVSHTIQDYKLNYYSGGYKAVITDKGYGGAYNYVTVSNNGVEKALLTEVGVVCNTFYGDSDDYKYVAFKVKMYTEKVEEMTSYNNGEIKLSNMF